MDVASQVGDLRLRATGSTVAFPGFLAVWGDAGSGDSSGGGTDEAEPAGDVDNDGIDSGDGGSTAATASVISSLKVCHPFPWTLASVNLYLAGLLPVFLISDVCMPEPGSSTQTVAVEWLLNWTAVASGAGRAGRDQGGSRTARHGAAAAVHGGQPREGAPA